MEKQLKSGVVAGPFAMEQDFVQLARLALTGRGQDVALYLRRATRRYRDTRPDVSDALIELLRHTPLRSSILKSATATAIAAPVDTNSRLHLVRQELSPDLPVEPVFDAQVEAALRQIIEERQSAGRLLASGLEPTSKALLVGPPGVGKTLAARYIARTLELPLFILDLSAVMSSFLGRTGANVRQVLDYARSQPCVLLLDELDAVAKRRDDATEIGELKRLVTVLLQEIDDWRSDGLLLAATNHPDLLDPAVWRRFDVKIEFPLPDVFAIQKAVPRFLDDAPVGQDILAVLMAAFEGLSFSDIERSLMKARRVAALDSQPLEDALLGVVQGHLQGLPFHRRVELASRLVASGQISQRRAHELTGVSRDTIRKSQRVPAPGSSANRYRRP